MTRQNTQAHGDPSTTASTTARPRRTPTADGTVITRIRGHRADLQPALARIADVVLEDPDAAAGMTIAHLAESAACSEATVVRFTKEIGFSGYREFRFALHQETAQRQGSSASEESYASDIEVDDDLSVVVRKIATADAHAVRNTVRLMDVTVLETVADALREARRVLLVGVGASMLPAMDLQQKLFRVGLPAIVHVDAHLGLPAAALLEPGDVLVAFSHTGRTQDVRDIAAVAAGAGATTVAVTEAPRSALARQCQHVLLTAAPESEVRSGATASRIAQLTVVDCLFMAVARRLPDLGRAALQRTRAAVEPRRGA